VVVSSSTHQSSFRSLLEPQLTVGGVAVILEYDEHSGLPECSCTLRKMYNPDKPYTHRPRFIASESHPHMKTILTLLILSLSFPAFAQDKKPVTLRSILLEQLRTTHNQKEWFVPVDVAVEGLTAEQATWKDGSGNHSVGQLTNHLLVWNRRELAKFKGEKEEKFSGNNDETFNNFDTKKWNDTVKQLDQVLTELEKIVETADEENLQAWA
jgi:hypothetical protein